jgi:pimeloyl-ACP methyl ester carboxylesterase
MSLIRVNDVSIYYEERGTGESIVCVHGMSSSAAVWGDAVDESTWCRGTCRGTVPGPVLRSHVSGMTASVERGVPRV